MLSQRPGSQGFDSTAITSNGLSPVLSGGVASGLWTKLLGLRVR